MIFSKFKITNGDRQMLYSEKYFQLNQEAILYYFYKLACLLTF